MSKRKKRLAQEIGSFVQQYRRPTNPNIDPNDRRYDRQVEARVRRLGAEEFQALLESGAESEIALTHELGLATFLRPERRARFRHLLRDQAGRGKLRAALAHFRDLDPTRCQAIPPDQQTPTGIEALLASLGAPDLCHVVSEDPALDGAALPLRAALDAVVSRGQGTLISCIPGRLAYFEGEVQGERQVLRSIAG